MSGKAQLTRAGDLWVMNLYGTRQEMAAQHGALLKEQNLTQTALPFFAEKLSNAVTQSYLARKSPLIGRLTDATLKQTLFKRLIRNMPDADRACMHAFANTYGINVDEVLRATVLADAGQWIVAKVFGKNHILSGAFGALPALGCSTISGTSTDQDDFIFARNLDYDSFGVFDRYPLVIYFNPTENAQRYTSFTSLGLHTAGITAINEAGLVLSLHQTMVAANSLAGTPILSITEAVIRDATTLDEAAQILKKSSYSGSWNIIMASFRERKTISVEVSAEGVHLSETDATPFCMTNHVHSEKMQKKEFSVDHQYYVDTRARLKRLQKNWNTSPNLNLQNAVDTISSTAKRNNIQSVVFSAAKNTAYIATHSLHGASPTHGSFHPIPFFENQQKIIGSLAATNKPTQAQIEAAAHYRTAARIATEYGRYADALKHITTAYALDPSEPLYPFMAGITLFRIASQDKEYQPILKSAFEYLAQTRELKCSSYTLSLIDLFMARYFDLHLMREKALTHYRAVDCSRSARLQSAVERGLAKPYSRQALQKMVIDYTLGDLFQM